MSVKNINFDEKKSKKVTFINKKINNINDINIDKI